MEKDKISEKEKKVAEELAAAAGVSKCKVLACGELTCEKLVCGQLAMIVQP